MTHHDPVRHAGRMYSRPGHRALWRGRWSAPGEIYLTTTTTRGRHRLFGTPAMATAVCRAFLAFDAVGKTKLLAWVLMPDHAHWLLQLRDAESLAQAMNRLKSGSARMVNREACRTGPIWSTAFHDRALRREEDLRAIARYVICNPVRAGLARRIGDYPYWDTAFLP